jgi:hypothetical protein
MVVVPLEAGVEEAGDLFSVLVGHATGVFVGDISGALDMTGLLLVSFAIASFITAVVRSHIIPSVVTPSAHCALATSAFA